jgi:hypothetical protein
MQDRVRWSLCMTSFVLLMLAAVLTAGLLFGLRAGRPRTSRSRPSDSAVVLAISGVTLFAVLRQLAGQGFRMTAMDVFAVAALVLIIGYSLAIQWKSRARG